VRPLVIALSIALPSASGVSVQAASPDDLDQIARTEICPADLHPYRSVPLSEACPEHRLNAISPDQMIQCRDDWLKDDAKIARYNQFVQRCGSSSKARPVAENIGEMGQGGRSTVWKQNGSSPSKILSYPPGQSTSVAKGGEDRIPSTSIQPASAQPTCMDACMLDPKMRGTAPGSPARKALCLLSCSITQ
jgi:hypothetical protein